MSNLFKIKNLCKSLAKEFGDTTEGQGYHMLYSMLEKEEKSTPSTIQDLWRSIALKIEDKGLMKSSYSIEISVYNQSYVRYRTYCTGESIEGSNPKVFYDAVIKSLEKNAEKLLKEQAENTTKNNIAL